MQHLADMSPFRLFLSKYMINRLLTIFTFTVTDTLPSDIGVSHPLFAKIVIEKNLYNNY